MKVVCIKKYLSTELKYELTYGKVYDVIEVVGNYDFIKNNYHILNDREFIQWYSVDTFVTIDEWRDKQLDKLGI